MSSIQLTSLPLPLILITTAVVAVAAYFDIRWRRIPNWLTLAAVLLGLASGALAAPAPRPDTPAGDAQAQALARASNAVLGVSARATDGALSSDTLGRERRGSGVVIDDGLVLTIGYLILEAEDIDLHPDNGGSVPARMVAYDVATGFGLLQALLPLRLAPVPLGNALEVADSEPLMFASGADGQGTAGSLSVARLASISTNSE